MKKLFTISLLSLVLLPIIWNGVSFFHYVIEHTHTFCESDINHEHTHANDCLNVYHISQNQDHDPLLSKIEFFELKQYITAFPFFDKQFSFSNITSTNSEYFLLYNRILSEDIFRPPIS